MVDSGLLKNPRLQRMANALHKRRGAGTYLFTGEQSAEKLAFIYRFIFKEIQEYAFKPGITENILKTRIASGAFPDYYEFPPENIKIGEEDKPLPGTIRHFMRTVLPYAPRETERKFVLFRDAARINDQAESALLKSLEEPPVNTVFILSAADADQLKGTIVSRALEVRIPNLILEEKVSSDPWDRFWYLSGLQDDPLFERIRKKEWHIFLRREYDALHFDNRDIERFERIGNTELKKTFNGEAANIQIEILIMSIQPLLFSIRDALCEGKAATLGPLRLPWEDKEKLILLGHLTQKFLQSLRVRYFGTRPPSAPALFYHYLSRLLPVWSR